MPFNDFLNAYIILNWLEIYIIVLIFESNLFNEDSVFQTNQSEPAFCGESPTSNRTYLGGITLGERLPFFGGHFLICKVKL